MTTDLPPPAPLWGEKPARRRSPGQRTAAESAMVEQLMRLDGALAAVERAPARPIILRIGGGIADHFKLRVAEWFATLLLLQFGLIIIATPNVFSITPGFRVMAEWADQSVWGFGCLAVGGAHFAALTINGTFRGFRYSPHIRALACALACYLWLQITLGIYLSGSGSTGVGTYRLVLGLEFWNFVRACLDARRTAARSLSHGE